MKYLLLGLGLFCGCAHITKSEQEIRCENYTGHLEVFLVPNTKQLLDKAFTYFTLDHRFVCDENK